MIKKYDYKIVDIFKLEDKNEHCVDLSVNATNYILEKNNVDKKDIGVMVFVTQSELFLMPSSSNVIHKNVKLSTDCFQYDSYQGGDGFIKGLQMVCSLLDGFEGSKKGLLIVADNDIDFISKRVNCSIVSLIESSEAPVLYFHNKILSKYHKSCYQIDDDTHIIFDQNYCNLVREIMMQEFKAMQEYIQQNRLQIDVSDFQLYNENEFEIMCKNDSAVCVPYFLLEKNFHGSALVVAVGSGITITDAIINI